MNTHAANASRVDVQRGVPPHGRWHTARARIGLERDAGGRPTGAELRRRRLLTSSSSPPGSSSKRNSTAGQLEKGRELPSLDPSGWSPSIRPRRRPQLRSTAGARDAGAHHHRPCCGRACSSRVVIRWSSALPCRPTDSGCDSGCGGSWEGDRAGWWWRSDWSACTLKGGCLFGAGAPPMNEGICSSSSYASLAPLLVCAGRQAWSFPLLGAAGGR